VNKKKLVSGDAVLFLRYEDLDSIKYCLVTITETGPTFYT